jgi:glycosyltransferase involved in cell wall biosynthesis
MLLRILYVINSLLPGGAEAVVSQWATCLQQMGHTVEICTVYTKGPWGKQLEQRGITLHDLALDPGIEMYNMRRKYDLRVVWPLSRLIRQGNYHIVHVHLFPASLFTAMASLLSRGQPYTFSEHNAHNRRRRWLIFKLVDWFIYSRYAQVIAVSEEVRKALTHWLPHCIEKIQVIPNAIDPSRFRIPQVQVQPLRQALGLNCKEHVVLYAGRMEPAKGIDVLIQAAARLNAGEVPVKFLIAGSGPLRSTLEQQAANLNLNGRVVFLGMRNDIPLLLHLADLVVLPSRWEGLPIILLEAMAAQRPVLATAVGGIPDVLEHGVSGWLVPPEDPPALAQAIGHLLQDTTLRQQLSSQAFQLLCTQYSLEAAMNKLLTIYAQLLRVKA